MKGKKNILILLILLVFVIPIGIHFLIDLLFNVQLDYPDIVSFFGSYVGGIVGVLGALFILSIQMRHEKNKEELKDIENYLKCSMVITDCLNELLIILNEGDHEKGKQSLNNIMRDHLTSESNYKSEPKDKNMYLTPIAETLTEIDEVKAIIINMKYSLENLNEDYILLDVYKDYKEIITILNNLIKFIGDFLENDYDVLLRGSQENDKKQFRQYRLMESYDFVMPVHELNRKFQSFNDQKLNEKNKLESKL